MRKYLMPWSGGLDSTAVLTKLLKQGHEVHAGYVVILNNEEKSRRELKAVRAMAQHFKQYPNFRFLDIIGKHGIDTLGVNMALNQPMLFLTSLIYAVDGHSHVALGYTLKDDAVSYLDDIRRIWSSLRHLTRLADSWPKLDFPVLKEQKSDSFHAVPREIIPHLTWCENANEADHCGQCAACKRAHDEHLYREDYGYFYSVARANAADCLKAAEAA